jgi:2-polyprenyl-3-methyl-5-hydroxy-6-metoxy-1,4-benzoquinol methylase
MHAHEGLRRTRDAFEDLGQRDPLWAVLTATGKAGGRWDEAEFFQTGQVTIRALLNRLASLGLAPPRGRALDFGCGVGRLTQALAEYGREIVGLDIAASMVERARALNRHGDRCDSS